MLTAGALLGLLEAAEAIMWARILGAIGVLWGGAILVVGLMKGGPRGEGAYAAGQVGGLVFGGLLFVVGLYYLVKGGGPSKKS